MKKVILTTLTVVMCVLLSVPANAALNTYYNYQVIFNHVSGGVAAAGKDRLQQSATPTSGLLTYEKNNAYVYTYNLATSAVTDYG